MKIGLAFSGGGARGAYQIGVVQALKDLGVLERIDVFSGTSIGAVNAAFVASSPLEKIIELWSSISPQDIQKTESWFQRLRTEKWRMADHGFFEIGKLRDVLETELDIQTLKRKTVFVTLSESGPVDSGLFGLFKNSYTHFVKKDSKVVYALLSHQDDKDVVPLILASCSIPVVFPAVVMGKKQYYDGGLYDNLPVEPLVQAGCDKIILIHLQLLEYFDKSRYPHLTIFELKHKGSLGGILHFEKNHAKAIYELGYADMMNRSEELRQYLEG
jgi:NTE family protein